MKKKLIIVFFIIMFCIAFSLVLRPQFWDYIQAQSTLAMFKGKEISSLTPQQKYLIFDAYYKKKDLVNTLRIANFLKDEAQSFPIEIRAVIAAKAAKILRADNQYDFEFMFFDKLLKDGAPNYYHFFRADTFKAQGKLNAAKEELLKAQELNQDPRIAPLIQDSLTQLDNVTKE